MIQQQVKQEFPTLEDIHAAAERLDGLVVKTPFVFSETISKTLGAEMWLKFENLQFTASFKERGALNKLLSLSEQEKQHGVIAASAGNHAQGVAYHAQRTGVTATIVMPKSTPNVKVQRVREYGARVILHGQDFSEAATEMHRVAQEESLTIIHPFDDAEIIAGQGTIALEMLAAVPELDILVVPIGGGGLISGIAIAAKSINPKIKVIGVQSVVYPSMAKLLCNYQIAVSLGSTVAEGIAVKTPGELTTQVAKEYVDDIVVVTEDMIEEAIALLLNIEKTVCEGAGATGIAAIMSRPDLFLGHKVGVVLSGGNIDTRVMVSVLQRHLTRTGRMVRIRVELPDNPGALARLTAIIAEQGGNIYELRHERFAATSRAKESAVSVDVELKSAPDLEPLIQAMQLEGYIVRKEEI
ncbi:threonine ammonia-lyase [Acinetobacter sp. 1130196]|uniref:threonine ammonia-lyase n=2 Tax=Acinetobacter TaxID=469 RepID=UPI00044AC4D2|nr:MULTISPECIES: threonine ammonia-lyase [Acinetobacter calcoaceticus/baumannii complex]EKU6033695.1 threonine ammonia-lyase [Acinetobacter nosocomialis]EXE78688.1 threonine ammonia-lyase [Acinetobacter sp. 1566109]EXR21836.1 threonine ammonia-lyase [Acinetobacter sp. 1130196]MBJ9959443.1 threonine ammonia-lyase [Acinetobacter nosocomialis]MBP1479238.1 threonine ammonia-lyase [Acinetobacter nosocomialis]